MYQKSFSSRSRRSSRNPNRFGPPRRRGAPRNEQFGSLGGRGPSRSPRSRGRSNQNVDINRYINKNPEHLVEQKYTPTTQIANLAISETLKNNIWKRGFTDLTPIQDKAIPLILNGKDIIGIANTGTGKTAAFLIPFIHKVAQNPKERVLIIAPTRELAQQINAEFRLFAEGLRIFSVVCIGGTSMYTLRKELNRPHNFLICTPGRAKDIATRGWTNLAMYNNVVIDEVDRMFDMGFQKDIREILGKLPQVRQTLFFSATISNDIEQLIQQYLHQPEKISINQQISTTNIMQDVVRANSAAEKIELLHELLIQKEFEKVLIFIQTKWNVKKMESELLSRGFKVDSIHGEKTQSARQRSLANFKENRITILLATDVAARGLDINNVSHVINYDQPATYDDYIHRIGRTGRGNKKGVALTFV